MKQLFIILGISILPFLGIAQQTINASITHDGKQRTYILYVPANYTGNEAVPLVFNFHGYTSNASQQMAYGDFRPIADTAGFIIVHGQGTLLDGSTHWNVGGWTLGSTTDDVGFTEALIDSLSTNYNIDSTRIYSTGMSNGGYMSFLLACQLSNKIAAIASVTGSMTPQTFSACNPQHPTPIMQIHGTSDGTVPYGGAGWTKSINDVIQYWITYNNCTTTPISTNLDNINTNDGSTVEHFLYDGGDTMSVVEHYKITGGGHTWPGTAFGGAGTNQDFNASEKIWQFFSQYDINGEIGTTSIEEFDEGFGLKMYPNPAQSSLTIELELNQPIDYQIINQKGQLVSTGSLQSNFQQIDISELSRGIYFFKIGKGSYKVLKGE